MFVNLYRKNGGPAVPLPLFDYTTDGYIRTNFEFDAEIMTELGWVFDSTVEVDDPPPLEPVDPANPRVLTRLQWILACEHFPPSLTLIADYLATLDPQSREYLYFAYTDRFNRDDPRYDAIETALGATEEDTDAVFAYGATIPP